MKYVFLFILLIHGLIHLMGFSKAFGFSKNNQILKSISKTEGIFWLITVVLFCLTIVLFLTANKWWWISGAPAVILSQILIILSWRDAKYGTIANIIILAPLVISFMGSLPSSYYNRYRLEAESGLSRSMKMPLLQESDMQKLPEPVRKYLIYTKSAGKPKILNFRAVFTGQFIREPGKDWMDIDAQQYNFYDEPTRLFYISSSVFGLPMEGLHMYKDASATMQIKVASLFRAADAKGKEMNQGETVTMFNDMCVLAPATLISSSIKWESIDPLTVKAHFTNKGNSISAILYFNEKGELINFSSDDRFLSSDGKTYTNYRWETPVKDYKEFNGRLVPSYAELVWKMPGGDFIYGKFSVESIEYNCNEFK